MRIMFVSYAESHSNKWVNALVNRGHDVVFVMQKSKVNHIEALDSRIKIVQLPIWGKAGYILNASSLNKLVKSYQPDVVNVHYASGYGTMARLARVRNLVLSVWGSDVYDFPYKNWLCMRIIKSNLLFAKKIASTSNCMAEQVRKIIGDKKDIVITPFGIDIDQFKPAEEQKAHEYITIGNIKVISPKYGIDDLVRAFAIVKTQFQKEKKDIRCVIYGRGKQREEIEDIIKTLNLTEEISLPGEIPHSEVPNALREIDIFCATSILDSESFGVSVVEAEAMGIPVVVTDVDGFKEVVEDGVTGIIVKRHDIQEIATALIKLISDEQLRKQLGRNGRDRVLKLYKFEDNVKTMENLYRSVCEE